MNVHGAVPVKSIEIEPVVPEQIVSFPLVIAEVGNGFSIILALPVKVVQAHPAPDRTVTS